MARERLTCDLGELDQQTMLEHEFPPLEIQGSADAAGNFDARDLT